MIAQIAQEETQMGTRDRYEDLLRYYEFIMGPLPGRDQFKRTLEETVTAAELEVFFLLPIIGHIPRSKLVKKAKLPPALLKARLDRLAAEGVIMIYTVDGETAYERGNPVFMTEQQVRRPEDTPRRAFYARFFNMILRGDFTPAAPTKTAYYRVLPVEATIRDQPGSRLIPVNVEIPDSRAVLPIDIVSEMIRRDARLIAVADCYCRRTRRLVGEGCEYPLQTCLVFNKGAETLIEHGTARRIDLEEALDIVRQSEELGLVHNVDNAEGEIGSLCNCCPCCSVLLTSWQRGLTNADSPSRYRVLFAEDRCTLCQTCVGRCPTGARAVRDGRMTTDDDLCLGCGLCVTACAQGANRMVLRERQAKLPQTADKLYAKIGREAIVGMAVNKIVGPLRRSR
jgi:Pyruvate/2-oxoacid:ferredoxin oxidoreductase delta subunit